VSIFRPGYLDNDTETFLNDEGTIHTNYEGYIHTKDIDIPFYDIISIDCIADFVTNFTDRWILKALINNSVWVKQIIPNRQNLEVSLVSYLRSGTVKQRFKAVIPNHRLAVTPMEEVATLSERELDRHTMGVCELQLQYLQTEPLPAITCQGVYRDVLVDSLLNALIKHYSKEVTVQTGAVIDDVVIFSSQNKEPVRQLLLPSGTPLLKLATLIQDRWGVYTHGIANYIRPFEDRKMIWWVYSLYDTKRWGEASKLSINLGDSISAINTGVTYQRVDNTTYILAAKSSTTSEGTDTRPPLADTGFMVADTDRMVKTPFRWDSEGVYVDPQSLFRKVDIFTRDDDVTKNPLGSTNTRNYFSVSSQISYLNVKPLLLNWHNSDHTILYPAMPVRVYLEHETKVNFLDGVLLGYHTTIDKYQQGTKTERYAENTMLNIVYMPPELTEASNNEL